MASFDVTKPMKRLNELLKEQQEPFCLHVYLLERGYSMKRLSSKGVSGCYHDDSSKELKCVGRRDLKRVRSFSKILKTVLEKIVYVKNSSKMLGCDSNARKDRKLNVFTHVGRRNHLVEDRSSKASSLMSSDSSSDSNTERKFDLPQQRDASQVCELRNLRNESDTDSKQSSPVSVLEELHTGGVSLFHNQAKFCSRTTSYQPKRVTEDMIFSATLWDMLVHSVLGKQDSDRPELAGSSNVPSQYLKPKGMLEQGKQLLFDCVREVLNTHGRKRRKRHAHELLGSEELGKIICKQIVQWGEQSGNVANINQLMNSEFCESMKEWNDFHLQTREMGVEIGDAIWEDIRDEIVTDIIDSFEMKKSLMM